MILLTQWDRRGNRVTDCGVSGSEVGGVNNVMVLRWSRWQNEGRSQTRLSLTGLHLHT